MLVKRRRAAVIRRVGESIELTLPDGETLEITIADVRPAGVTVVIDVGGGLVFRQAEMAGESDGYISTVNSARKPPTRNPDKTPHCRAGK